MNDPGQRLFLSLAACVCLIILIFGCTEKDGIIRSTGTTEPPPGLWKIEIDMDRDVLQGHFHDIDLTLSECSTAIGGFDLLIGYDASALVFTGAGFGRYFADCGWEYFTYRYSWNDDSGRDCPSGLIQLVGIAEINNGANHPDFDCIAASGGEILATLQFFISNDRALECTTQPIRFYWQDCGDNVITTPGGDSLGLNNIINDFNDSVLTADSVAFPGYFGAPDDPCMRVRPYETIRAVDFVNGAVDIVCPDSIDDRWRGDINCNTVANEIADAFMLTDYFISGLGAFGTHVDCSVEASDCNFNGVHLELADLSYLVRVIVGDALPNPEPTPDAEATLSLRNDTVSLESSDDVGAVLLVFNFDGAFAPIPALLTSDMDMKYGDHGNELRVLIYNIGSDFIPEGRTDILSIRGTVELIEAEAAAYEGFDIPVISLPAAP